MSGFFCTAFVEYMIAEEALLYYTNLLSLNDDKKNDKIMCKFLKEKYGKRKCKP